MESVAVITAEKTSFKACLVGPLGVDEEAMAWKPDRVVDGIRDATSGVEAIFDAISERGMKPHKARNGVRAKAISGL